MSSSSNSKRRKVTVDIKQTKLERGSVFARLGNKEKRKKLKPESESGSKSRKDPQKSDCETVEERKKSKSSKFDDGVPSKKSSKEYSKSKANSEESKEYKKSQRYGDESEMVVVSETGRTHSKHKSDRGDRKLEKMENLIIEKRVSPSSSLNRSRSVTPSSSSPKKKSKKHSSKNASLEKGLDYQRYTSESPERSTESHKHKERGRSREKKKSSKESSKKSKEYIDEDEYDNGAKTTSGSKHSSLKAKKSSKHVKYEKEAVEDFEPEKKSKPRHLRDVSVEKEKIRTKISPVVFDNSSDENFPKEKRHEKHEERGKAKRRKYENASPSASPIRHKKSKRHSSVEEEVRSAKNLSPVKHFSKKRSHKETEVVSKKKLQKEDSLLGTYSDYSSASKHSQPEFSEISQASGANDEPYSSDSYVEKETKKRPKMKKKNKKDVDTPPSKSHYEVIDDDFSDDVKKVKKKKRKREETLSPGIELAAKDERYLEKERRHGDAPKKKAESYIKSPIDRGERPEKYERGHHDSYERQSSQRDRSDSSRRHKIQSQVKADLRSPKDSYFERDRDTHDRRRDQYQEPRPAIHRYSPDRRDQVYSKDKLQTRHLSPERSTDSKVLDWQRKTSKHLSTERKEVIPRLMSVQYTADRRSDSTRPPAQSKYVPQRKMHSNAYSYPHDTAIRSVSGERGQDRRPPPLLPTFSRNRSPPRVSSHIRDNRSYNEEQDRFGDLERKSDKTHHRDPAPRNDSRDRSYLSIQDEIRDHHVRSSSHDSRSSFRHSSLENKPKGRLQSGMGNPRGMQSPHSDRNSSLERRDYKKPVQERLKLTKNENYERRPDRSLDHLNTKSRLVQDRHERGRPSERSRPVKRHFNDNMLHSVSQHDGSKKKRFSSKDVSPRRRLRDIPHSSSKRHSDIESDRHHRSSRRRETKEKSPEIGEDEIDELIKEDNEKTPPSEVDWNELKTDPPKGDVPHKETSSVLKKFSPGNILRRTGIIMDLLPQSMIDRISELEDESLKNEASSEIRPSFVSGILQNGLHSYSDQRLRKHLLGHNTNNQHDFYPPRVINAKTYSASMKEYMRKMRLVEAV